MRCDLHVHTRHSGMCNIPLVNRVCLESYNEPEDVYRILKQRGMDLVTVTDHDSIDAAEQLRHYPDFFLSEEVTGITPSGTEIHIGVYGIQERDHLELQRRRGDLPSLAAYLDERHIFSSVNHIFSGLTGRREDADFALFEELFPALETRNGQITSSANQSAATLARYWRKVTVGGSDAHTLDSLGLTYTDVPGSGCVKSFLGGLRRGCAHTGGTCGSYDKLTRAVIEIGLRAMRENPRSIFLLGPLAPAVPGVTLMNYIGEFLFHRRWSRRVLGNFTRTENANLPCEPDQLTLA